MINFRERAAGFVLCNDNIEEALILLDNAENTIPEEVTVWDKFEYDPLENILDYINTIAEMLEATYKQGVQDGIKPLTMHGIKRAILNGEPSIHYQGREIKLPTPQRAGTHTQQDSYANIKANEIYNGL